MPDLTKFTVVQLKELLRKKGLKVSGNKAELIARLDTKAKVAKKSTSAVTTVVELKKSLRAAGLKVSGTKAELVARLAASKKVGKQTKVVREGGKIVKTAVTQKSAGLSSFTPGIKKVLSQVHRDKTLAPASLTIIQSIVNTLGNAIVNSPGFSVDPFVKRYATRARVLTKKVFSGKNNQLAAHAYSESLQALERNASNYAYSLDMIQTKFLKKFPAGQGRTLAASFISTVLEYITAEILDLSGNSAHLRNSKNIIPKDISLAMWGDEELQRMVKKYKMPMPSPYYFSSTIVLEK
jgi:histone H2A